MFTEVVSCVGGQVLRELFSDFLPRVCQKVDSLLLLLFLRLLVFYAVNVAHDCSLISFVQLHVIAFRRDVIWGLIECSLHNGSDLRVPSCHLKLKHVQTGLIRCAISKF